jgi:hypothetical protein
VLLPVEAVAAARWELNQSVNLLSITELATLPNLDVTSEAMKHVAMRFTKQYTPSLLWPRPPAVAPSYAHCVMAAAVASAAGTVSLIGCTGPALTTLTSAPHCRRCCTAAMHSHGVAAVVAAVTAGAISLTGCTGPALATMTSAPSLTRST